MTTPASRLRGRRAASRRAGSARAAFARPKSSTFTRPSVVSMMLAGLRSRWTMPFSWAAASASARAMPIVDHPPTGSPPSRNQAIERLALHQLHREEAHAAGLLDRVDGDDVRVIERGDGLGLALEALRGARGRGHVGGQHLERDVAPSFVSVGAIDFAHPAGADGSGDPVVRERGADQGPGPPGQVLGVRRARLKALNRGWILPQPAFSGPAPDGPFTSARPTVWLPLKSGAL